MKVGIAKNELFVSLSTGIFAGLVIVLLYHSDETLKLSLFGLFADIFCFALTWIGCPLILSLNAKRFYFVWGMVPGLITLLIIFLDRLTTDLYRFHKPLTELDIPVMLHNLLWFTGCVLASAGPVSLARWLIERRRKLPVSPAEEGLAIAGKDSAWPPAPRKK